MKLFDKPSGLVRDAWQNLKQGLRAANRQRLHRRRKKRGLDYTAWIAANDTPSANDRAGWRQWLQTQAKLPTIDMVLDAAGSDAHQLKRSIDSLSNQVYPRWQLTVTLPASGAEPEAALVQKLASDEPRIRLWQAPRGTLPSQHAALAWQTCQGDWTGLLHPGDQLREQALLVLAQTLQKHPDAAVVYPDEDQVDAQGRRSHHQFKPDWNADYQESANYIGHVRWITRAHLIECTGGEPMQDYEVLLRCTENLSARRIVHVPQVLWHRAAPVKAWLAQEDLSTLQSHLDRHSPGAKAEVTSQGMLRVRHAIPTPAPLVSIVICTRNQFKLLQTCIDSITRITRYPHYEIIVVDNGSDESRTLDYLAQLPSRDARIRVIRDDSPFNYAALNNMAVGHARGELVALLNNDIEAIHADWLDEMVSHALRPEVGCVGAKLLYPDDTVQHVGVLVGPGKDAPDAIAAHYLRGIPRHAPGYANRAITTLQLTAVTAACLVIRKATFLQVGGLDAKNLAVTYNDVDFCLRVREMGLHNVMTPHAVLYHHESVSRGRDASSKNKARFLPEQAYMQQRWAKRLKHDPCYNPNLSHQKPDFLLA